MIMFENEELELGVVVMSNLLDAMERRRGHGVKEMREWLANVKRKIRTSHTLQ